MTFWNKKTPSQMTAATVEDRGKTYGHPLEDFTRTAALWTAILGDRLKSPLNALDVAQMMRMVKESRLVKTPNHFDSLLDICGYADCQHACIEATGRRFMVPKGRFTEEQIKALSESGPVAALDNLSDEDFQILKHADNPASELEKMAGEFKPIAWPRETKIVDKTKDLAPGVSVWLLGDENEWIIEAKMTPDGDLWNVRSAKFLAAKTVELAQIGGLWHEKVDLKA